MLSDKYLQEIKERYNPDSEYVCDCCQVENDIPALVAEVERLKKALEKACDEIDYITGDCPAGYYRKNCKEHCVSNSVCWQRWALGGE